MLTNLLVDLASLLEGFVSRVDVTPAEPPAPSGENCDPRISVWAGAIYHSRDPNLRSGAEATCFYRRTYDLSYRLDLCLPIRADGNDLSTAEWLAVSTEFYGILDAVWCSITDEAVSGTLFTGLDSCESITVGELIPGLPQGGMISATGTIQVTAPCEAGS